MEGMKVAYIVIWAEENVGYYGGVMVVDRRGLPLEFYYTEKISPTNIQKILYGSVLSKFIKENVISDNLYKNLKNKPDFLVLEDRELAADELTFPLPILYLEKVKVEPLKAPNQYQEIEENTFLLQTQRHKYPIMLRFANLKAAEQKVMMGKIVKLDETLDLFEPIDRIKEALQAVAKETQQQAEKNNET